MSQQENYFAYPTMLNLKNKKCVIIGGGGVAARKLASLCSARADVTVIAPQFSDKLLAAAQKYPCTLIKAAYDAEQIKHAFVVIAATNNFAVNRQITADAPFLCNNITEPALSNFTVPSYFTMGDIAVSLATGGNPAYTRLLKTYLQNKLTPAFAEFNVFLYAMREAVKDIPSTPEDRTAFWRGALTSEIINLLENGNLTQAKENITNAVNSFRAKSQNSSC